MKKLFLVATLFLCFSIHAQTIQKEFLIALPDQLSDISEAELAQIANQLDDAKIIGTTEGIHGYQEPFVFRNKLIQYLVENKLIDIVLLESGLLDSHHLNDYIHSKTVDLEQARINGFTSGKQTIQENIELLKWLRSYNSDPGNSHKIDIYGIDVSGSMGAGSSKSEMNTPIQHLLSYLEKTAFERDVEFIEKIKPSVDSLKVMPFRPKQEEIASYEKLKKVSRDEVTATINDLISNLETYRYEYIDKTSEEEYKWAHIAAISARHIDDILRKFPLPGEPLDPVKIDNSFYARLNGMVENISFLLDQNPDSRFLIFAASNHLFKSPAEIYWPGFSEAVTLPISVGNYLNHRFDEKYKLINHFYLKTGNETESLDGDSEIFSNTLKGDMPNYFLPLKGINSFSQNQKVKFNTQSFIIPVETFDFILFTESISAHQRVK